ncbi:PBSX family phage terminase large subunit [Periweissella cryptocerci]|uniref:PBSX family phage terminase large subunit n=1 Tax=Periweissella cryptocerci TaxID=2506420 RepID=A0A4P6YRZ5_9LACO|nr:PBSX family phage terminase large subunit [Periweissella cryptocerci]QBO35390.1 PBSX family phage terminase large subunit [Periweissella cryptocerci]
MSETVSISKLIGKGYNRYWNDRHFYKVVKGSRGSKKSKTTALWYIYHIMKYDWANILVVRRYSHTNKQSTFTDLQWAVHKLKVDSLFKFNSSLPEIEYLPTGQKIIFRGLDDPLKITSISVAVGFLTWVWFEESYQLESWDAVQTVIESIRGGDDDNPEFFKQATFTFNPWSERHWLKSTFFDEDTKVKDVFAYTTTYKSNEWLTKEDIARYEDVRRTNPRRARITLDGEWGVAEGLVYENFVVEDFSIHDKVKNADAVTQGMDFGFKNDPTTYINAAINFDDKDIWLTEELYQKGMLTDEIFAWLKAHDHLKEEIKGDEAEQRLIAELKLKGVRRIIPSAKGKDSIRQGIQYLQGFTIHIHPSLNHTIDEINTYAYDQDREGKWLNKPIDANNHIMDALRYAVSTWSLKPTKRDVNKTIRKVKGLIK